VSASGVEGLASRAALLPAGMTSFFGFECRLGREDSLADLLVLTTSAEGGAQVLAGRSELHPLTEPARIGAGWAGIRRFAELWSRPDSGIDYAWLEFDLAGSPEVGDGEVCPPSIFFHPRLELIDGVFDARRFLELAEEAWTALLGTSPAPAASRSWATCAGALPRGAQVFNVGVMVPRATDLLRICVNRIANEDVVPYLERIGWTGSYETLKELLEVFDLGRPLVDFVTLDLDVGPGFAPGLGVEAYFNRGRQPSGEPRWAALLDRLVERGLCTPAKREGLLAYPGVSSELDDPGRWPANLRRASELLGDRFTSVFRRTLNHVKLSVKREGIEAKAYLAVVHRWATTR
jgi:hypothetical protein